MFPGIREHPEFPNVPFHDYVRLANDNLWVVGETSAFSEQSIGWQTVSFIHWYCKQGLLDRINAGATVTAPLIKEYLEPITLLHMEYLNKEVYEVLKELGYDEEKLRFILSAPKIIPGKKVEEDKEPRGPDEHWAGFYDAELKNFVRERERLLFELFPEWDV